MSVSRRLSMVVGQVQPYCSEIVTVPPHPENDQSLAAEIAKGGFTIICRSKGDPDEVIRVVESAMNVKSYEILADEEPEPEAPEAVAVSDAKASESMRKDRPRLGIKVNVSILRILVTSDLFFIKIGRASCRERV